MQEWRHQTMDSAMARRHIFEAFMTLDNSGPIYRGDNLDQLSALSNQQCRLFLRTRHDLEKLKMTNQFDNKIAFKMLASVFSPD